MKRSRRFAMLLVICTLLVLGSTALFSVPLTSFVGIGSISAQAAWAPNTAYAVGTQVTYNGRLYQCAQSHTSQTGWEPPNVPALWTDRGPVGTVPTATRTNTSGTTPPTATRTRTNTQIGGATATRTRTNTQIGGATATRTRTNTSGTTPPTATRTNTTGTGTPCWTPWSSSQVYTGGMQASDNGRNYQANWWNQGDRPSTSTSGAWADKGACGGTTPATATRTRTNTSGTTPPTATRTRTNTTGTTPPTATTGPCTVNCTLRKHILVGYWHNFDNGSGNIKLRDVSPNWDVINVSFAEPTSATSGDLRFAPYNDTVDGFKADIAYLKGQGKKVIISIGGANGQVRLENSGSRDMFVNTMGSIISTYGFDGLDIDFEGHSLQLNAGDRDINAPTTPVIVNLISAIRSLKTRFGSSFMITMAPETFFVQLGYSFYGGTCAGCDTRAGAYLPVIHALRNDLNWLQVQNYNSGPITGLDNQYHTMGNADFHIAMLDMLLAGFPVAGTGQTFTALRPDQVVMGVPANVNAGGGYVDNATLIAAMDCIVKGTGCGGYTRRSSNNANFRGVMSWSINWDKFAGMTFSNGMRSYLNSLP